MRSGDPTSTSRDRHLGGMEKTSRAKKAPARSFRDLLVWQRAMELAKECHSLVEGLPPGRLRSLRDQIQRCSCSIPANIAEGNGRQRIGDSLRYLSIASGSLRELQTHLELAARLGLAPEKDLARPRGLSEEVGRMPCALTRALERRRSNPDS